MSRIDPGRSNEWNLTSVLATSTVLRSFGNTGGSCIVQAYLLTFNLKKREPSMEEFLQGTEGISASLSNKAFHSVYSGRR